MKPLYLCAGLQSSGSTVVSWCFLQRADMDGVFDARNDVLPAIPAVKTPLAWCKITISSFRYSEMAAYYEDEGWAVHPLLVVRDVRAVFNSLLGKHYGSNGITAEEPPLRMRMRRFKEDYQLFRNKGWPVVCYETLVKEDPEPVLRAACDAMQLPWDDGMLNWPKKKEDFAAPAHGSPTFRSTLGAGGNLRATINPRLADLKTKAVPPDDLDWMEREFLGFNHEMGYPEHAPRTQPTAPDAQRRAVPKWENTRRHRKSQKPLAKIIAVVRGRRADEERE
jgi:hypothetical protein